MPDWQERITRETEPAIRAEHDARYRLAPPPLPAAPAGCGPGCGHRIAPPAAPSRLAAPLAAAAPVWCDRGCGTGIAAAAALDGFTGRAVLVDIDQDVARGAAAELGLSEATPIGADLATAEGVQRALGELPDGAV